MFRAWPSQLQAAPLVLDTPYRAAIAEIGLVTAVPWPTGSPDTGEPESANRLPGNTSARRATRSPDHGDRVPPVAPTNISQETTDAVRALRVVLEANGVEIIDEHDELAYVAFKALDPDGHRAEAYWEPPSYRDG